MSATSSEKAILLMLSDVLEALNPPRPSLDPAFVRKVVQGDHFWAFDFKYTHLKTGESQPQEVDEVLDILALWRTVETSFNRLGNEGQQEFLKATRRPSLPTFEGFDSQNEGRHLDIAEMLVLELDRYPEFESQVVDSHGAKIAYYRQLVSNTLSETRDQDQLYDLAQLVRIFQRAPR